MTRARKAARWSAFLGLATVVATPAMAQYVWSLGDLSNVSSRLDVNWDLDDWADGYDSEAELNALGWSTVNVTSGINCAAGGRDSSQDQAALQGYFRNPAYCSQPSGDTPGVCNKVFKLQANCTYDVVAGTNGAINGSAALNIQYSNFALIGADPNTSVIAANNTVSSNATMVAPLFSTGSSWGHTGGPNGATYAWGGTSNKGQASLTISGSCAGLVSGDLIQVVGTDGDGAPLDYRTRITNSPSGSNCTLIIADPLPTTFAGRASIIERGQNAPKKMIFLNFTAGFPYLPAGVGTGATDLSNAMIVRMRGVQESLFQGVTLGPYGQTPIDGQGLWKHVIRHSTMGPGLHTMRRQNNAQVVGRNVNGSLMSIYNNVLLEGATRLFINDGSMQFGYFGFNYHVPQISRDSRENGNYCTGITNPQGFPNVSAGPERSIFLNHDPAVANNVGHILIEANDFKCQIVDQGLNPIRRYTTFYRNRILNHGWTSFDFLASATTKSHLNIIANRANSFDFHGATTMPNALGRWNTAVSAMNAPGGTNVVWPTSGTGRNYVDSGPHDDYATTNLPPSLGIRTNSAPSWWCQESGPWNGSWSFGYGDGGDNGGTPRKLPAQIRHEGGGCTPPSGTTISLPAPVFLE